MRVRAAALAGDRVDALDVLRPHLVEPRRDQRHGVVLAHARLHRLVEVVIRGVHHAGRMRQQRDLVLRLDLARVRHQLLAVDDVQAFLLRGQRHRRLDDVDADRLLCRPRDSSSMRILRATSSERPISGVIAPRISGMPARERSPSQSQ